jgi:putative Mn2+ efflux pump MntP
MSVLEIIVIAVGLSMDAFAVSITVGLSLEKPKIREVIIPGIFFGFFQALMPILGYVTGIYFAGIIQEFDHWIAFALLGIIGGKMIKESLSKKNKKDESADEADENEDYFQFRKMLVLALATSIDALAIGVTFAFLGTNIIRAAIIIGSITFMLSMAGVKIGNIFGARYKSKAEFAGGAVLVLLGIKIVIEHLLS